MWFSSYLFSAAEHYTFNGLCRLKFRLELSLYS